MGPLSTTGALGEALGMLGSFGSTAHGLKRRRAEFASGGCGGQVGGSGGVTVLDPVGAGHESRPGGATRGSCGWARPTSPERLLWKLLKH